VDWSVTLSLSAVFTASINSGGVQDHLVCSTLSRVFSFCSVLSCCFRLVCLARVWFILNLLHGHKLPSFRPGLHQGLQTMIIGSLRLKNQKRLLMMSKLLSQHRLFLSKVVGLTEIIRLTALTAAKMLTTAVAA
jgi:hypothetical protein